MDALQSSKVKRTIQDTVQNKGDLLLGITITQLGILVFFVGLAFLTFAYMRFEDIFINYILSFSLAFLGVIMVVLETDRKLLLFWHYKSSYDETVKWLKVLAGKLYVLSKKREIGHIIDRFPNAHQEILHSEMALLEQQEKKALVTELPRVKTKKDIIDLEVGKREMKKAPAHQQIYTPKLTLMQRIGRQESPPGMNIKSTNADARRIIKDISLNYDTHLAVKDFLSDAEMAIVNRASHMVLMAKHGFKIFVMAEFEKSIEEMRKILGVVDRSFYAWVIIVQHEEEIAHYVPLLTDKGNIILFEKFAEWIDPKIK